MGTLASYFPLGEDRVYFDQAIGQFSICDTYGLKAPVHYCDPNVGRNALEFTFGPLDL